MSISSMFQQSLPYIGAAAPTILGGLGSLAGERLVPHAQSALRRGYGWSDAPQFNKYQPTSLKLSQMAMQYALPALAGYAGSKLGDYISNRVNNTPLNPPTPAAEQAMPSTNPMGSPIQSQPVPPALNGPNLQSAPITNSAAVPSQALNAPAPLNNRMVYHRPPAGRLGAYVGPATRSTRTFAQGGLNDVAQSMTQMMPNALMQHLNMLAPMAGNAMMGGNPFLGSIFQSMMPHLYAHGGDVGEDYDDEDDDDYYDEEPQYYRYEGHPSQEELEHAGILYLPDDMS